MIILDLCGGTGAWSEPYRALGYDVRLVTLPADDVRTYVPPSNVHGILAAPPCTEFSSSGARWWAKKDPQLLRDALDVVSACMRIITSTKPAWWALENPVGRLASYIGPYRYTFQPWEYGDPWYKRTCIWGTAVEPATTVAVAPPRTLIETRHNAPSRVIDPQWVWRCPPGPKRAFLRSITSPAFARAFAAANP